MPLTISSHAHSTKHEEYNQSIQSPFAILTNIMEFHCFSKISVYHHKQIKFNTKFLSISRATLPLSNKNDGAVVGRKVHLPSLPPHKEMKFITISFLALGSNSINPFNIEADSSSVVFR